MNQITLNAFVDELTKIAAAPPPLPKPGAPKANPMADALFKGMASTPKTDVMKSIVKKATPQMPAPKAPGLVGSGTPAMPMPKPAPPAGPLNPGGMNVMFAPKQQPMYAGRAAAANAAMGFRG